MKTTPRQILSHRESFNSLCYLEPPSKSTTLSRQRDIDPSMFKPQWRLARSIIHLLLILSSMGPIFTQAQVLIYQTALSPCKETPSFEFYDGGWILVDTNTESVSFVLTSTHSDTKSFTVTRNSGELFYSAKANSYFTNIRATSITESTMANYLLTGEINSSTQVKNSTSMAVASQLYGYLLASEIAGYDKDHDTGVGTLNLVGMVAITSELDKKSSDYYNLRDIPADQIMNDILSDLIEAGFIEE